MIVFSETYLIIFSINYLTQNENIYIFAFMLGSFSLGIAFFYRQGYQFLFLVWHFPQLKSVKEHSEILLGFIIDIISAFLTIVLIYLIAIKLFFLIFRLYCCYIVIIRKFSFLNMRVAKKNT